MWVDRDDFFVKIYEQHLLKHDFVVQYMRSGEQLLRKISKKKPDLIILSVLLPEMNGFRLLEELRSDPATQSVPVVVVSSLGEKSDLEQAWQLKAAAYFIKSHMKPTQLVATVQKILSKSVKHVIF